MTFRLIHAPGVSDALDEVETAFMDRLDPAPFPPLPATPRPPPPYPHDAPSPPVGGIGHAFLLDLEHPPVQLGGLFAASEMFDFHEVAAGPGHLIVDVLEVTPTRTRLHVKPDGALTYAAISAEVATMVDAVGARVFGGQLRVSRLEWLVQPRGIPSLPSAQAGMLA